MEQDEILSHKENQATYFPPPFDFSVRLFLQKEQAILIIISSEARTGSEDRWLLTLLVYCSVFESIGVIWKYRFIV